MKYCRLCAQPKAYLLDVSSSSSDGTAIVDLIESYLSLEMGLVDGSPAVVCSECSNQLMMFHRFASQVHEAQVQMQHLLDDVKNHDGYDEGDTKLSAEFNGEDNFKQEWVKEEVDENYICAENGESSGYNFMIIEPQIHLTKKRQRKPKIFIENEFENRYMTDDIMIALKNEIKCEDIPLSHYKRAKNTKNKYIKIPICKKIIKIEDPIICYICNETSFNNLLELKNHQQSHLAKNTTHPWPCVQCDKMFKARQSALHHIRVKHEGVSEFICHECGRTFSTKGNLEDHLTTHSNVTNFDCDKCGKKFKLKQALMRHLDTHQETVYQCPKCALLLNSRRTLRNHMFTHDEVGRQECHICGKKFKLRKTLKLHFHIHTGERPYKCMWCDKTFANNSNCRIHKKRVHTLELMKYEAERGAKGANGAVSRSNVSESCNKETIPMSTPGSPLDIQS